MAKGTVNKVILLGRLGQDPDVRYTPNGSSIANLNLATNESWRNKSTNEQEEQTEWHRVVCFGRTAEIAGEYLRKGSQVYIEGRIRTRKWQDKNGQDRYTTEIVANEMQFIGGRGEGVSNQFAGGTGAPAAAPQQATPSFESSANTMTTTQAPGAPKMADFDQDFDDDIPF